MNITFEHRLRLASILIIGASLFFVDCTKQEQSFQKLKEPIVPEFLPSVQVSEDNSTVMVKGVFNLLYDTESDLSKFLSVYVIEKDSSWSENNSPILGSHSYLNKEGTLVFKPKYPFLENTEYYVRFNYNSIVETPIYVEQPNTQFLVEHNFVISRDKTPVTFVEEVYPTSYEIPRNLLKFYIQFSGSMSNGEMLDNIRILDDQANVVEHAFLEIPQELWDTNRQRLTILFDPGRIKRGMELLDEVGAPFEIGKEYTLQINPSWKDGQQRKLTKGFIKKFLVIEDDRIKPKKEDWEISVPDTDSKDPLIVNFDESLDYALLQRAITILDSQNRAVTGRISLVENERLWQFTPNTTWKPGSYTIKIETILEDLAGNNLISVFDVDLNNEEQAVNRTESTKFTKVLFNILDQ